MTHLLERKTDDGEHERDGPRRQVEVASLPRDDVTRRPQHLRNKHVFCHVSGCVPRDTRRPSTRNDLCQSHPSVTFTRTRARLVCRNTRTRTVSARIYAHTRTHTHTGSTRSTGAFTHTSTGTEANPPCEQMTTNVHRKHTHSHTRTHRPTLSSKNVFHTHTTQHSSQVHVVSGPQTHAHTRTRTLKVRCHA